MTIEDGFTGTCPTCGQRDLSAENQRLRELLDAPPYVDCICPGCPRKVPQAWASGLCETCAAEDCEHTDGAKATWVECEELKIEVERLRAALTAIKQAFANRCCGALKWNALWDVAEDMAVMAEAALGPHVGRSP